jgi:hypothetical protein
MKDFDLLVLGGLLICAAAIGIGLLIADGTFQFAGAFFGWFLAAYSSLRYFVQAVRFALRTNVPLWGTLIPVNFALALVGVSIFGVHSWNEIKIALAVFLGAFFFGLVLARTSSVHARYVPLLFLLFLLLPFYEKLSSFWTHIYLGVASSLLTVGLVDFMKRRAVLRQAGSLSK